ncbi:protein VACUOLELESS GAMETOPHYTES-like [Tasmannia lanceolata]|uniref:protein VACUOLELESS GAMETOPHYTES-like n=1 Tax=Tasmannia lanceolata TaxID=3420 RepID=UPI004062B634
MSKTRLRKTTSSLSMKSPLVEIPTMLNPNGEEEIVHFSHPRHPLAQVTLPYLFMCMGCKEFGAGRRFRCQKCDFDLHEFCALAPPSLKNHHLHVQHPLVFYSKSGGFLRSKCDVCGKSAKGYAFRCTMCNFEMHPCCTLLDREMDFPTHPHTLNLSPTTTLASADSSVVCGECQRKRSGRFYNCTICNYHLHAVCSKDMVNGLYVHGIRAPEKPNMLGAAAKLASNAIIGFIGGMLEGIGEGLGEVLIQNVGRGKAIKSRGKEANVAGK